MTTKRTYRSSQTFTCSLPSCGREFKAHVSDRPHADTYCCTSHAAKHREERLGHCSITMPCEICGEPVTRPNSQIPGRRAFCSREHYYARNEKVTP